MVTRLAPKSCRRGLAGRRDSGPRNSSGYGPFPAGDGRNHDRQTPQVPNAAGLVRVDRRAAEQVALAEVDLAFRPGDQTRAVLDSLGNDLGPDAAAERDERLDQGLLGLAVLVADPGHDFAVDLDDRRLEGGDDVEAGVAGAGVVDGEAETELAQGFDLLLEL